MEGQPGFTQIQTMKICMMTNTYLPHVGGVARSVHTFSEEYRKLGHEVLVVAPEFPDKEGEPQIEEQGVVRLPAIQQFNGSDFSVRLPISGMFNTKIEEFEANIIHSHHPFLLGDTALRWAASKHAPIVFTHHTLYEEYTHYVPFDSPGLKQFTMELSTSYANLCDAVIAPSESIAKLIRERGVEVPIKVIPTGIDVEGFASGDGKKFRKENKIAPDAFVVGHLGRLAPEKNLSFLCRAVCLFLRKNPEAVFLLVGGGSAEDEIRAIFEKENLISQLIMPGKKGGQDLFDAYRAMNVFAFSSFSETQGMVLAEAMAAGLPVVALDASGVREVVRNDQNGFMLPADASEESFAECLEKIHSDLELRKRFKAGARRTARKFSKERSAAKALKFYEKVRAKTRPQRREERESAWAALTKRLEVEWRLISDKAGAVMNAIFSDEPEEKNREPKDENRELDKKEFVLAPRLSAIDS
jgi:1,2-diacylglycerol 3-alpha-glucosyltransferase